MRTRSTVFVSAAALAAAVTLNAQTPNPQTPSPQTPTTQPQTDRARSATDPQRPSEQAVTITGCLKEEKDVPGRSAGAGMNQDYVLTNVKMGQGSATSAMGLASMYEVKGIDDSELKKHLNHQVEVVGRLGGSQSGSNMAGGARGTTSGATTGSTAGGGTTGSATGGSSPTAATGTGSTAERGSGATSSSASKSDLPELHATSIRMVAQTCPAQ